MECGGPCSHDPGTQDVEFQSFLEGVGDREYDWRWTGWMSSRGRWMLPIADDYLAMVIPTVEGISVGYLFRN